MARLFPAVLALVCVGCTPALYRAQAQLKAVPEAGTLPLPMTQTPTGPLQAVGEAVAPNLFVAPPGTGAELLADAVTVSALIKTTVESKGIPDAIEMHPRGGYGVGWFELYYKSPPRTFVFSQGSYGVASELGITALDLEMEVAPRSVSRLCFGTGALPPPWPVTIAPQYYRAFGVPALGDPVPAYVDGRSWSHLAHSLASEMGPTRPEYSSRVEALFKPLKAAAPVPGLEWKVIPFPSSVPTGFGVPDGTLFVSTALIERLDDVQLLAILAHLMGHERHQHYPHNVETARAMRFVGTPPTFLPEVPKYPDVLTGRPYGYTRSQEIEANRVAVGYLGKVGIPPDTLFDALYKLSGIVKLPPQEWPDFAELHHLPRSAADFGRLLDAGAVETR